MAKGSCRRTPTASEAVPCLVQNRQYLPQWHTRQTGRQSIIAPHLNEEPEAGDLSGPEALPHHVRRGQRCEAQQEAQEVG